MKTLLSVNIPESQKGEFPDLGPISWGHFRLSLISLISLRFHFLQRSVQPPGVSSPCSLERCWLSDVTINKSSRQRTRSSTAHQFCTPARPRGLNGEPCR